MVHNFEKYTVRQVEALPANKNFYDYDVSISCVLFRVVVLNTELLATRISICHACRVLMLFALSLIVAAWVKFFWFYLTCKCNTLVID